MNNWYITTCRAFILTSLFCFTVGIFGNQYITTNGYITAFATTIISVILILTYMFSFIIRNVDTQFSATYLFNAIFMNTGPFLFMLVIAALTLTNLLQYKSNIINTNVGSDYIWYSEAIVLFMFLQLIVIFVNIGDPNFETTGLFHSVSNSTMYLFNVLSMMSYTTFHKILVYYTTDGFIDYEYESYENYVM